MNQHANPMRGLDLLHSEMARQHDDALASLRQARANPISASAAAAMRRDGRALLVGMGGSHWINRIVEPLYRQAGIDTTAIVASELLRAPMPTAAHTVLLTSQSGRSGEVLRYLGQTAAQPHRFGITLDPRSDLARTIPSLIGAGGLEKAFAATRSLLMTLAMHGAVLEALQVDVGPLDDALARPAAKADEAAVAVLACCQSAIFSSRGALQGVAEAGALTMMELARIPVLALEGGQFRHGPYEIINNRMAMVLIRPGGPDSASVARLAEAIARTNNKPIVFDLSGDAPLPHALTIALPPLKGLAAAAVALPALQAVVVPAADRMVENVGIPVRSSKITDGE